MNKTRRGLVFLSSVLIYLCVTIHCLSHAAYSEQRLEFKPNSLAEQWIIDQLQKGYIVDLKAEFPEEEDRVISPIFIEKLLTSSLKDIGIHRHGVRIGHAVFTEPVDLENAEILNETVLVLCQFKSKANFSKSICYKNIILVECSFFDTTEFYHMKVHGNAIVNGTKFFGAVDFSRAEISGDFKAQKTVFRNPTQEANFNSLKVSGMVLLNEAEFSGKVDFSNANISSISAAKAKFKNSEQNVDFFGMKIRSMADFTKAEFSGPVNFNLTEIGGNFSAAYCKFKNAEQKASFLIKVGGNALLNKVEFSGPVDFSFAKIDGMLFAGGSKFKSSKEWATFRGIRVGFLANFARAEFSGPVNFHMADIKADLVALGAKFKNVKKPVNFTGMKVGNSVILDNTDFRGPVRLAGMTYKHISRKFQDQEDSWKKLIELVNRAALSVDVYTNLESFFRRMGYPDRADTTFVAMKRRERRENLRDFDWISSFMWDILVRYGTRPGRAFFLCIPFIIFGTFLFRQDHMENTSEEHTSGRYYAFWYSADLFVPIVDFHLAKEWRPKNKFTFTHHYMRIHQLFGWLLIPIGLAAWTGIIK